MGLRRAKLMDFGIAHVAGAATLTATGEVVGTLSYMAPEQAEGLTAGPAADVYSLALTLFECWAGEQPVAGGTPAETARRIGRPVSSLAEYRPDLPRDIVAGVDACLAPNPAVRPTASEFRDELEAAAQALDDERAVPVPAAEEKSAIRWRPRAARVGALGGWAVTLAALGWLAGFGGLALVLAALTAPGLLLIDRLRWTLLLPIAPVLGATSAGPAFAAIGSRAPRPVERACMGALGWCWMLVGAALGLGPRLGLISRPPSGWAHSTAKAADALLAPLVHPEALLGMGVFALAALALGVILGARHVAIAALGALLWAAAVNAATGAIGNGGLSGQPVIVVVAALGAVVVSAWPFGARSPLPPRLQSRQGRIGDGEPARVVS
jgi:eukaryotic-like serine/threonine-protein kinase